LLQSDADIGETPVGGAGKPMEVMGMGELETSVWPKDFVLILENEVVTFPREAMELIKLLSKGVSNYP
jgi:hypothetical protein